MAHHWGKSWMSTSYEAEGDLSPWPSCLYLRSSRVQRTAPYMEGIMCQMPQQSPYSFLEMPNIALALFMIPDFGITEEYRQASYFAQCFHRFVFSDILYFFAIGPGCSFWAYVQLQSCWPSHCIRYKVHKVVMLRHYIIFELLGKVAPASFLNWQVAFLLWHP